MIPKRLREEAGIAEDSRVKAKVMREGGVILMQPLAEDPVSKLASLLAAPRKGASSVTSIRTLRKKIDREAMVRGRRP